MSPLRSTLGPHSRRQHRTLIGLCFVSPWLVGMLAFVVFPFAASLYWSFCRYDMLQAPGFVGLEHYKRLFVEVGQQQGFGLALTNTLYYAAISVPLSVALAILLAVMLSWKVRGRAIYRTLFFVPSVVPVVASSILWLWLLDPQSGVVNQVLSTLGLPPQNWFQGTGTALFSLRFGSKDALILMSLWGVGNFMVIYLAALGDVPAHLYEAAELDGAGAVRRFTHVTLPMLTPVIFFNIVMGLIQSVQAFTQVYIVSEGRGEPAGASLLLSLHLFLSAFQDLEMGYASAMAWMLLAALVAATGGLFYSAKRWVHYRGAM